MNKKRFEQIEFEDNKIKKPFGFFQRLNLRRKIEMTTEAADETNQKILEKDLKIKEVEAREREKMAAAKKAKLIAIQKQEKEEEELQFRIQNLNRRKNSARGKILQSILFVVLAIAFFLLRSHI